MKPHELKDRLTEIVRAAVTESLPPAIEKTKNTIQRNIPSNRTRTKRAVRSRIRKHRTGYQAVIRLRFSRRYKSRGSRTEQIFEDTWRVAKPHFLKEFERNMSKRLKGN